MRETVMPDLPINPTLEQCQQAYTTILDTSLKSLPKRRKKSVQSPHNDGWSPMMVGIKAQTNMLRRTQWHLGTGGPGSKWHWGSLDKRQKEIIRFTTTWEEVTGLKWPEENGVKQIDPKV